MSTTDEADVVETLPVEVSFQSIDGCKQAKQTADALMMMQTTQITAGTRSPARLLQDDAATAAPANAASTATNANHEAIPATRPTKSHFGGLIGSSNALRPFKSPVTRADSPSGGTDIGTPAKRARLNASTPSRSSGLTSTIGALRSSNAASKPFKSPFSKVKTATGDGGATNENQNEACSMTSLQLAAALPALEKKLAMLKSAKRNIAARERALESADNTDRIRELSQKWLIAGREAADDLWSQMKDSYGDDAEQLNANKSVSTFDSGFSNWGWDKPESTAADDKTARLEAALDAMTEEERQSVYRDLDIEEEKGELPTIEQIIAARRSKVKDQPTLFVKAGEYQHGRATEHDDTDDDRDNHDNHDNHDTAEPEEPEEPEIDEGPQAEKATGMARMLQGCGVP